MRLFLTLLFIGLLHSHLSSQEFAPIGAIWHVEVREPFTLEWTGTLTNESIRDTLVKGMSCKILFKSHATIFNEIYGEYILCQQGDSIFHYIKSLDSMNLVMDFGAEPGESWESFDRANEYESFGNQFNYKYIVDSLSHLYVSDQDSLMVQHLTVLRKDWDQPDSEYRRPRTDILIENLGFMSALLPTNDGDGLSDDQYETDIRCYQDGTIGLVKLTEDDNCITSSVSGREEIHFDIYPNPTNGFLYIGGLDHEEVRIMITDYSGREMGEFFNTQEIDLQNLHAGIYFLQVIAAHSITTRKILLIK